MLRSAASRLAGTNVMAKAAPSKFLRSSLIARSYATEGPDFSSLGIKTQSALQGKPESALERPATIFRIGRFVGQAGSRGADEWRIEFNREDKVTYDLMGWTGTADPLTYVRMDFPTKDDAVRFAERNGLNFVVEKDPNEGVVKKRRSYADNFKFKPLAQNA
eukprot:TRINITY_DN15334_c0_g1_i1.p1 TRINITY_DN15334_c0_g1~~TRINITY_DN15334_c0_g1_i1.p1  ORF type:complete len:185 (-),score=8.68 TRINITY_DN15334_c0_g1_i1:108-593(-)